MYQRLQQKLGKIQSIVQKELGRLATVANSGSGGMDGLGEAGEAVMIQGRSQTTEELVQSFDEVKQLWAKLQSQPQSHPRWQSLCTEIHKQLRLAEMDVQFWAAARQSETVVRRGEQLCDRLSVLITYCDAGIKLNQQNGSGADADVLA